MVMHKKDILTMNKIIKLIFVLCCFCGIAQAQPQRPKLVVGIVIDQMRWDYLYRYYARYGEGGFKRMLGEGFSVENCKIPYIPFGYSHRPLFYLDRFRSFHPRNCRK